MPFLVNVNYAITKKRNAMTSTVIQPMKSVGVEECNKLSVSCAQCYLLVRFEVQTRYPFSEVVLMSDIQGKNYLGQYVILSHNGHFL